MTLLGPNGDRVATDDDGGGGLNSLISIQLPQTGRYSVIVNAYSASGRGRYRLTVATISDEEYQQRYAPQGALQLFNLSWSIYVSAVSRDDYERALDYAQQSLARAQEIQNIRVEGYSLFLIGIIYTSSLGRYQEAVEFLERSFNISEQLNDHYLSANSLATLSLAHVQMGNYEDTIIIFDRALEFARGINYDGIQAMLYIPAYAHVFLGNYQEAIGNSEVALSSAQRHSLHRPESHSLSILGLAYFYLGDYERALDFSEQSLAIGEVNRDRLVQSNPLFVIGAIHIRANQ